MNTRLQVEHPVTEQVHGIDLVAWQTPDRRRRTPAGPGPPPARGHAVEARLYAEDPARDWQPQTGILHRLDVTTADDGDTGLRLDSGVTDGERISVHYDPMLAKVVAWAPTRRAALRRLADALQRARIHGPVTNRDLLVRTLRHPDFAAARLDTGFYDRHLAALTARTDADHQAERLAALAAALADAAHRTRPGAPLAARLGGWRNNPSQPQTKTYRAAARRHRPRDPLPPAARRRPARRRLPRRRPRPRGARTASSSNSTASPAPSTSPSTTNRTAAAPSTSTRRSAPTPSPRCPASPRPARQTEPGSLLAQLPGTVVRVAEGLAAATTSRPGSRCSGSRR